MKTLNEILTSKKYRTLAITNNYIIEKNIDKIQDTLKIAKLKNYIPMQLREYVKTIFRKTPRVIQIGFTNYVAEKEFKKYNAKTMLINIKSNKMVVEEMQLQECEKIESYLIKSSLILHSIEEIEENILECSHGEFDNKCNIPKIKEEFEKIREIIKSKIKRQKLLENQHIDSRPTDSKFSSYYTLHSLQTAIQNFAFAYKRELNREYSNNLEYFFIDMKKTLQNLKLNKKSLSSKTTKERLDIYQYIQNAREYLSKNKIVIKQEIIDKIAIIQAIIQQERK